MPSTPPSLPPVGRVHSPFRDKFGIPRQGGLVPAARGHIELLPPCDDPRTVDGLADFSHLWVVFLFHATRAAGWRPQVRPPRLGGNRRVGVFASRSPFRPNPLGLSLLRLEGIDARPGDVRLRVSGLDLLDGTPVLDIKPYLPWSDAVPDARAGFAPEAPPPALQVHFTPRAEADLRRHQPACASDLRALITQLLQQDPRPAYRRGRPDAHRYGLRLYHFDLQWRVVDGRAEVLALTD